MSDRTFQAIVVGAGPAGEVIAGRLAEGGMTVALVEPELVGGECSFWACMPSKALLRPAELLAEARRVPGVAGALNGELDVPAILARRDEVIHDLDDSGQLPWLESRGIELLRGAARFTGERRVRVTGEGLDEELEAEQVIVLATGTSAAIPPVEGLAEARPWTNREATTAKQVPERLAVLGGGVVGVEMAQAYRSLGARVTVIEAGDRLLAREEPFAAEDVAAGLRDAGVDIRLGARAAAVRTNGEEVTVELEEGPEVVADELLVATGRRPNTAEIGLEAIGLEPGGYVEVDDRLRVRGAEGWLYAIGDVNGRALLTHMGKYQARIAAKNILGGEASADWDGPLSPRVVFTNPQVAAVGHTVASAKEAGIEVRVAEVPTEGNAGGSFVGKDARGTCRVLVDDAREVLVGATFTGPEVAESIHAATVAIVGEIPLGRLAHAVPSFPTRTEIWLGLLEELGV